MPLSKERLLTLALERLQSERARIDSEIGEIQAQLRPGSNSQEPTAKKRKRRSISPEQRKAVSERMKKSWAKRKKQALKE